MRHGKIHSVIPMLTLALALVVALPGYSNPRNGFSGVTGMTLTCTRNTGVNEAIAVDAPQSLDFAIAVDGGVGAHLQGDVHLLRLNGSGYEWKSYFSQTNVLGKKTVRSHFPRSGPIPNTVGRYQFQAWLRQKDGTQKTSNIITVIVYKVRCVKITATHDQDIYWPNTPHTDDRVWAADPDVYAATGKIKAIFDRKRIADILRPDPQHYKLAFTFQRYPTCRTSQKLSTDVSVKNDGTPATSTVNGWTPSSTYIWVRTRTRIGRRAFGLQFTFRINSIQVGPIAQTITDFMDYAIYDTPRCSSDSFTNNHLYYACVWGDGSVNLSCDGSDSIPWVVHNNIMTAGYTFSYRENPWVLLTRPGDCDTHANLMKETLAVLGIAATTSRMTPSPPLTRNNCGIPEHYWYRDVERKRFRYGNGGEQIYTNWHGVCTVVTSDKGAIHYDILGHRAYGTSAQMQDEDDDTTKADFEHDVINGDVGWVYDLENNQRGVCTVPQERSHADRRR